jgi:uncharacterized membrane protein YozB (DUF420 family)
LQVIHTHFWMKRQEIVNQIEGWISDMETQCGDRRTGRAISLNAMALKVVFMLLVYLSHSHQYSYSFQIITMYMFVSYFYLIWHKDLTYK